MEKVKKCNQKNFEQSKSIFTNLSSHISQEVEKKVRFSYLMIFGKRTVHKKPI